MRKIRRRRSSSSRATRRSTAPSPPCAPAPTIISSNRSRTSNSSPQWSIAHSKRCSCCARKRSSLRRCKNTTKNSRRCTKSFANSQFATASRVFIITAIFTKRWSWSPRARAVISSVFPAVHRHRSLPPVQRPARPSARRPAAAQRERDSEITPASIGRGRALRRRGIRAAAAGDGSPRRADRRRSHPRAARELSLSRRRGPAGRQGHRQLRCRGLPRRRGRGPRCVAAGRAGATQGQVHGTQPDQDGRRVSCETSEERGNESVIQSGLRILVIDDEVGARAALRDLLREQGHQVPPARSGEEALPLFRVLLFSLVLVGLWLLGLSV